MLVVLSHFKESMLSDFLLTLPVFKVEFDALTLLEAILLNVIWILLEAILLNGIWICNSDETCV